MQVWVVWRAEPEVVRAACCVKHDAGDRGAGVHWLPLQRLVHGHRDWRAWLLWCFSLQYPGGTATIAGVTDCLGQRNLQLFLLLLSSIPRRQIPTTVGISQKLLPIKLFIVGEMKSFQCWPSNSLMELEHWIYWDPWNERSVQEEYIARLKITL